MGTSRHICTSVAQLLDLYLRLPDPLENAADDEKVVEHREDDEKSVENEAIHLLRAENRDSHRLW